MIVADASLISAFILKEKRWKSYASLLKNAFTVDHAIKEVSNAIWKAYIKKHIGVDDVKFKFEALKKLFSKNLVITPESELLDKAMEIALKHEISVYDSLYLALAVVKRTNLSSLDEEQIRVAKELNVPVIPI